MREIPSLAEPVVGSWFGEAEVFKELTVHVGVRSIPA